MHLRNLLLIIPLLWSTILNAQDHEVIFGTLDSLLEQKNYQQVLEIINKNKTNKLSPLIAGKYYRIKGDAEYYLNRVPESLQSYLLGISRLEQSELLDPDLSIYLQVATAQCYTNLGLFEKADQYGNQALKLAEHFNDTSNMVEALAAIATNSVYQGNYEKGLEYSQKLFSIDKARNDSLGISYDLNDLAFVYNKLGQSEKAISYYKNSLNYVNPDKHPRSYATKLNNIGMTYGEIGNYDSAFHFVQAAHDIFLQAGDQINAAKRQLNLGVLSQRAGLLQRAENHFNEAEKVLSKENERLQLLLLNSKSELLIKQNKLVKAKEYISRSIDIASRLGSYPDLVQAYNIRKNIAVQQSDFQTAYGLQEKVQIAKDSMANQSSKQMVEKLGIEYEVYKKEAEIELLTTENELATQKIAAKSKELMLLSVIAAILIIATLVIILVQRQKFILKKNLLSQEIDTLRAQINFAIDGKDIDKIPREKINESLFRPLSEREYEILKHAVTDKTNNEIAETVFVSVNTVKYHLKNIYEKLGVSNRKEALEAILRQT